jgi:hypothetical protein
MVAVDCTVQQGLCAKFDVNGYPTLKYFGSSEDTPEEYDGDRDTDALVAYGEEKAGDDHDEL